MTDATKRKTRSIEIELEIGAPREAVWKALTDPRELERWFPLQAEVTPGEGGCIRLAWGPGMDGRNGIRVWEPGRRLQTGWCEPAAGEAAPEANWSETFQSDPEGVRALAVEYLLEGEGGRTTLRLVHSGFRADARWDDEYESHRRGWTFELRSLRHYLERHRGTDRRVAWIRTPTTLSPREAWSRLFGPEGLARQGSPEGLGEGDRFALTTARGERMEGTVVVNAPPLDFAGTVVGMGDALLRYGYETWSGTPEITLWLSSWGRPASDVDAFEAHWRDTLGKLVGT